MPDNQPTTLKGVGNSWVAPVSHSLRRLYVEVRERTLLLKVVARLIYHPTFPTPPLLVTQKKPQSSDATTCTDGCRRALHARACLCSRQRWKENIINGFDFTTSPYRPGSLTSSLHFLYPIAPFPSHLSFLRSTVRPRAGLAFISTSRRTRRRNPGELCVRHRSISFSPLSWSICIERRFRRIIQSCR